MPSNSLSIPGIGNIINFLGLDYLSITISYVLLWIYVLYVWHRAKRNRFNAKSVVTEYEPPVGLSPQLARYILVAGRTGGRAGEISQNGLQRIILIDLYENGGLKELSFVDELTIEYEIDPNYRNRGLKEDQLIFLEMLEKKVGMQAMIQEAEEESVEGFAEINKFWFDFWNVEMHKICTKLGYFGTKSPKLDIALNLVAVCMTFGIFLSVFAMLIPFIGPFIVMIILFPLVVIFLFSVLIARVAYYFFDIYQIPFGTFQGTLLELLFLTVPIITWFVWFMILGSNTKMAFTDVTSNGRDIISKINGYRNFLRKVDKDRISFSLDKDLDFERNNTSFSWLAIFGFATDRHWDQFYEAHSKEK